MAEIDFLPMEYHLQHARNQVKPWRIVVVACAGVLMAAALVVQYFQRRHVLGELNSVSAVYDGAAQQDASWTAFETKLDAARSEADVFTYLRHPWPRSPLLSAGVRPMPAEVCLLQLEIADEAANAQPLVETRSRAELKAAQEKLHKAPPATRDLTRLREECDGQQTFVRLAGTTADTAALYRYLNDLAKSSYFAKVELKSIESADTPQGPVMHFQASLRVLPGYGQPGGPSGKIKIEIDGEEREPMNSSKKNSWIVILPVGAAAVAFVIWIYLPGAKAIAELCDQIHAKQDYIQQSEKAVQKLSVGKREMTKTNSYLTVCRGRAADEKDVGNLFSMIHLAASQERGPHHAFRSATGRGLRRPTSSARDARFDRLVPTDSRVP